MIRNYLLILICGMLFLVSPVYAENNVDYTLTITKDYKFNEVVKYEIEEYEQIQNGYNPFADIVDDDIEVDIMGKAKYNKKKEFRNGKYYVTLTHTYSEYSISNSILLNDCFEDKNYEYDMEMLSFTGKGGFYCLKGDSLKITIITDFEVTSTNATVNGNKYVWNPKDNKFNMEFDINKVYELNTEEQSDKDELGKGYEESGSDEKVKQEQQIREENNNITEDNITDEVVTKNEEKSGFGLIIAIVIIGVIVVTGVIAFVVLKRKNNNLNKI